MIKYIKYDGYSAQPSDYACPDGELATSADVIKEDGSLRPTGSGKIVLDLGASDKEAVYIHVTQQYRHYIIKQSDTDGTAARYLWRRPKDGSLVELDGSKDIKSAACINAIGNVLIIYGTGKTYYYLFNLQADNYSYLGDHVPEVQVSFGLQGHPRCSAYFNIDGDFAESDEKKAKATQTIMGKINKLIADECTNKSRFCMPFFVRYALRMYDGTLVNHSAPILMIPSTEGPAVYVAKKYNKGSSLSLIAMLIACDLDYQITDAGGAQQEGWADIVKSIDVFISRPIYPYNQDGTLRGWQDVHDNTDSSYFSNCFCGRPAYTPKVSSYGGERRNDWAANVSNSEMETAADKYAEYYLRDIYRMYVSEKDYSGGDSVKIADTPAGIVELPQFDKDKNDQIADNSEFYLYASIPQPFGAGSKAEDETKRKVLTRGKAYLQSLATREAMTDDFRSHESMTATMSYTYNGRIILGGVTRKVFAGYAPSSMLSYCNAAMDVYPDPTIYTMHVKPVRGSAPMTVEVSGVSDGTAYSAACTDDDLPLREYEVGSYKSGDGTTKIPSSYVWGNYLYYPLPGATKIALSQALTGVTGKSKYVYNLRTHDFMQGSYYWGGWGANHQQDIYTATTTNKTIAAQGKVYSSIVNNPFAYPADGVRQIGAGQVLAICSAAKPLSQGQFGQFPLYAFATDGVWALRISNTGYIEPAQPFTRDVLVNDKSICSLDSAVVFASSRGLMLIEGSKCVCISDTLDNDDAFDVSALQGYVSLVKLAGANAHKIDNFDTFLGSCRMLYDYRHQRIIVYNTDKGYAYVYSLKDKAWGMQSCDIKTALNGYPQALASSTGGKVTDMSQEEDGISEYSGLVITRPLKLGEPDKLKTIEAIIQRGKFAEGHVQQVLYGSRDLANWVVVASSADARLTGIGGTPYKYFRVALTLRLAQGETLDGCTVQYTVRYDDVLR